VNDSNEWLNKVNTRFDIDEHFNLRFYFDIMS
jgi:hypothetical protein